MEIGIPTDLIQKLQLSLRSHAGLSTYDPDDPTLPALPSLSHSVAALDPSPSELRCRHCRGKLLGGQLSDICFYCGGYQPREEKVEPIGFRSTVGCRWLLQSLDLDGSEIVETSIDGQVLNRGQSMPRDKIPLSDVLNLEISWPAEMEIIGHRRSESQSLQSKSLSDLAGVDLDNLFTYAKILASNLEKEKEKEKAITNKQTEDMKFKAFNGQEHPSFPPSVQLTATSVSSNVAKDNFSGWEADFQFADSGNQPEPSKSSDQFVSSSGDLSTHLNSVFGSVELSEVIKPKNISTPSLSAASDLTQHDLRNSSTVLSSHVAQQVETATEEVNDHTKADDTDWFTDDQWQTQRTISTENKPAGGDEESFDVWNNFTSSSNPQELPKSSSSAIEIKPSTVDDDSSDVWNDFESFSKPQDPPKSSSIATEFTEDSDSFYVLNNFKSSFNPQDPPKNTSIATETKPSTEDDDSFDVWNNFRSSSNPQDPPKIPFAATETKPSTEDDNSHDVWNNVASSSKAQELAKSFSNATEIKPSTEDGVSFDAWNHFTSSSNQQDPPKSSSNANETKPSTEEDDSSDVWDDFTSSSIAPSNIPPPTEIMATTGDGDSYDVWNDFTSSFADAKMKPTTVADDSSDVWNSFTSSSNARDPFKSSITATDYKPTTGVNDSSDVWDGFSSFSNAHEPRKSLVTGSGNKPTTAVDDSSDVWSGFTSSSNANDPFKSSINTTDNKTTTGLDDSSDVWDVFSSSFNVQNPSTSTNTNNKTTTQLDDSSDVWDVFSSSFNVKNPSKSSNTNSTTETATIGEQTLDTMLPSPTNNFQDMDFGSFLQSDVFSGSTSDKNGAVGLDNMQAEVSTSKRMAGDEVKAGVAIIASKGGVDDSKPVVKPEDDLANLFSQMHDLSFMLKTELSLPSVKNDPRSSQDLRPNS